MWDESESLLLPIDRIEITMLVPLVLVNIIFAQAAVNLLTESDELAFPGYVAHVNKQKSLLGASHSSQIARGLTRFRRKDSVHAGASLIVNTDGSSQLEQSSPLRRSGCDGGAAWNCSVALQASRKNTVDDARKSLKADSCINFGWDSLDTCQQRCARVPNCRYAHFDAAAASLGGCCSDGSMKRCGKTGLCILSEDSPNSSQPVRPGAEENEYSSWTQTGQVCELIKAECLECKPWLCTAGKQAAGRGLTSTGSVLKWDSCENYGWTQSSCQQRCAQVADCRFAHFVASGSGGGCCKEGDKKRCDKPGGGYCYLSDGRSETNGEASALASWGTGEGSLCMVTGRDCSGMTSWTPSPTFTESTTFTNTTVTTTVTLTLKPTPEVVGDIILEVSDPWSFTSDPAVKECVLSTIEEIVGSEFAIGLNLTDGQVAGTVDIRYRIASTTHVALEVAPDALSNMMDISLPDFAVTLNAKLKKLPPDVRGIPRTVEVTTSITYNASSVDMPSSKSELR